MTTSDVRILLSGGNPGPRLLSTMEALLPLSFVAPTEDGKTAGRVAAEILHVQPASQASTAQAVDCLVLPPASPETVLRKTLQVSFSASEHVPLPFRGRTLESEASVSPCLLNTDPDEIVLAECEGYPVWTMAFRQGRVIFRSAFPLLEIAEGGSFSLVFSDQAFLQNLPLMHFLRRVGSFALGEAPPLRAVFMFDDPNLHWPTYGCIDYRDVVARARKHNYHVSFATIPLDTWFTHRSTAEIFQRNPELISLLVHGNNHSKNELARQHTAADRRSLLSQALARVARLEESCGVSVCRVMVPPHGGCSSDMLAALAGTGFDSTCVSAGSLIAHNAGAPWIRTLGYHPAENIMGCAVLPRAAFTGKAKNAALISAYLGRPIVLRGHQDDLKHGVELLDELAGFINGLGDVTWTKLSNLTCMSYRYRLANGTCYVTPLARNVTLEVPEGTQRLVIEADPQALQHGKLFVVMSAGFGARVQSGEACSFPDHGSRRVKVAQETAPWGNSPVRTPRTPVSLIMRRLLTEGRDRFLPA